jgi:site-specific DNA recombinase
MRVIMTQDGTFRYLCSMTTAAIYARLSQDKRQGTSEEGASVTSQIEACKRYIRTQGWTLGEVYKDNSISATSGAERPAFERMLKDAPGVVVAFKQDRLSRDLMDTLRIKAAGITGYMCDGGRLDFSSADAEMMTIFRTAMDSAEGRKKAERQKLATLRDARAGKYRGSIRPFGQERSGEWVPAEAEAVREAAVLIASGKQTFFKTAELWNAAGLLTPATGKQGGKHWTSGTVRNYFTRPRLIGFQEHEGTLYKLKDWNPLLNKDTFDQIQTLIEGKRTGKRGVSETRADMHLLTGIAQCVECGRGMNSGQRGGAGSTRLYRCPTVKHQTVVAAPLEDAISLHTLDLLMHHEDAQEQATETSKALAALMSEKRVAESEHEKWLEEAVDAGLKPFLIAKREDVHRERISGMDDEILRLNQDMKVSIFQLPAGPLGPKDNLTERNLSGWRSISMEQRRDLLKTLFESITVDRAGQGKRFKAERVTYHYTSLGQRLSDKWAETEVEFLTIHAGAREGTARRNFDSTWDLPELPLTV